MWNHKTEDFQVFHRFEWKIEDKERLKVGKITLLLNKLDNCFLLWKPIFQNHVHITINEVKQQVT